MTIDSKTQILLSNKLDNSSLRLIDANLNRLREGIRVLEDVFRYIYNDKKISSRLKNIRHKSRTENYLNILSTRDIKNDVLKDSTKSEQSRDTIHSILIANFKRTQESARVLEEFFKIVSTKDSENFKLIRYELYDLETLILNIDTN